MILVRYLAVLEAYMFSVVNKIQQC